MAAVVPSRWRSVRTCRMVRLAVGLSLALLACAWSRRLSAFAASSAAARSWATRRRLRSRVTRCAEDKKELQPWEIGYEPPPRPVYHDDFSDADIEKFFQETISGAGGEPPPGKLLDLINTQFAWTFCQPKDATPFSIMKEQMRLQTWRTYGGPKGDTPDDGKGWVWLAAEMTVVGLCLQIYTSIPYGRRPILVAKADDTATLFEKVNWAVAEQRMEQILGTEVGEEAACQPAAAPAAEPTPSPEAPSAAVSPPAAAAPAAVPTADAIEAAQKMRVPILRERLRLLGLDDSGTKTELVQRLVEAEAQQQQ
eukprot:TRINITY_DN16810_c0_g3_i3.p2 TRINITY_DN16810_c0_g3~~TRINITY_DN16810_c0_g3_i3.p2  ORF type:complete len:310 (+),score=77.99 TRINITY_DN16810_c0_g3_i3:66-995(+)